MCTYRGQPYEYEKERGGGQGNFGLGFLLPPPPPFLPPRLYMAGGRAAWEGLQVGFLLLGRRKAAPLPLPPIYTWGGGA